MNAAERRDVVRDAIALIVASFDDQDVASRLAADLVNPRTGEDLAAYAGRIGSTLAVSSFAAASFLRHWSRTAGLDERLLLARYAETVSADLNARDLADADNNNEGTTP